MTGVGPLEAGVRALMRGDLAEAERCWRAALEEDPSDARAREYLAAIAGESAAAAPPSPVRVAEPSCGWDDGPTAGARIVLPPDGGVDLSELTPGEPPVLPPPRGASAPDGRGVEVEVAAALRQARDAFSLGDFSGSLAHLERVLALAPGNAEALAYLHENEDTLVAMYESRLGPLDAVPTVRLAPEDVLWLNLDHRAGFVLAQIDGTLTWDDLFTLSGLSRLETARILARLVDDGVVGAG